MSLNPSSPSNIPNNIVGILSMYSNQEYIKSLKDQLKVAKLEINELKQKLEDKDTEIEGYWKIKVQQLESLIDKLNIDNSQLQVENNLLKNSVKNLQDEINTLHDEIKTLKQINYDNCIKIDFGAIMDLFNWAMIYKINFDNKETKFCDIKEVNQVSCFSDIKNEFQKIKGDVSKSKFGGTLSKVSQNIKMPRNIYAHSISNQNLTIPEYTNIAHTYLEQNNLTENIEDINSIIHYISNTFGNTPFLQFELLHTETY